MVMFCGVGSGTGTGAVDGIGLLFTAREADEDLATSWLKVSVGAYTDGRVTADRTALGFLA